MSQRGAKGLTWRCLFVFQDTGLSESMEIDHNSSANFDEVRAFIIITSIMHANQLILFFFFFLNV